MTKLKPDTSSIGSSWDTYWQGTGNVGAFTSGGVSHPAIRLFWKEFFSATKQEYEDPRIIDIASGNGAVLECALEEFNNKLSDIKSLDISAAAIENIHNRFPAVRGIVSDACSIPLESGSYDLVTSQFGVEYAGHDAVFEAARLVADGGKLALIMHCDSGSIHQECLQSLEAIERLRKSRFIQLSIEMLDAGFKAVRGADRSDYDNAVTKLPPSIKELEAIINQYGEQVAGDTIVRLYNDVGQIHQRMQHYEPEEVLNWLGRMDGELTAYAQRMSSMCQSAINDSDFKQLIAKLEERKFTIVSAEKLIVEGYQKPMAWILVAKK